MEDSDTRRILKEARLLTSYWGKRILKAEARGSFNEYDEDNAANWTTCACGKQDPRIPRHVGEDVDEGDIHCPEDTLLTTLGQMFYSNVCSNSFVNAANTLVAIEERASEVLFEVLQENSGD